MTTKDDFKQWLIDTDSTTLYSITLMKQPVNEYLPNYETFVKWFYEYFETFYEKACKNRTQDYVCNKSKKIKTDFIQQIVSHLTEYSTTEQAFYTKIVLSFLINAQENIANEFEDCRKEKIQGWHNYSEIEYYDCLHFNADLSYLIDYFELHFTDLNHNLDFKIIDKSKNIDWVDDPYPTLNWYIETATTTPKAKPVFKLSEKKGAKTDLIRVLNALYELRFFTKIDGQIPTKQEFMETMGEYLGVDLSKYHTNLSQALQNQPLEVNLKVFEEMEKAIQNAHYQTNNK